MNEKSPLQRWCEREPEGWSWMPRVGGWWSWVRRRGDDALAHGVGALRFAARALVNIDRWNWARVGEVTRAIIKPLRQGALWIPRRYTAILGTVAVGLTPVWLWLIWDLFREVINLIDALGTEPAAEDRRNIAYALGVTTAALAGLVAAPLMLIRAWVAERHTRTAEEGLITERFTKAVEQLGAEKTAKYRARSYSYIPKGKQPPDTMTSSHREDRNPVIPEGASDVQFGDWETFEETVPNLEVRLGAIYALERIAQDSERDHIAIMETLCAYVRQNAPASAAQDHDLGDWEDWPEETNIHPSGRAQQKRQIWLIMLSTWIEGLPAPRVDIQAALSVIGRRGEERIA